MENKYLFEDYCESALTARFLGFANKSFLVTGATGMIGKNLVSILRMITRDSNIILVGRSIDKIESCFGKTEMKYILFDDLEENELNVDIIIHLASPTNSKYLNQYPVETIDFILNSTTNILNIARKCGASVLFVSSMEAYGEVKDNSARTENELGFISLESTRNSYPEAKRMCELICYCYNREYNLDVKVARLSQTFGAGTSIDDPRVFGYISQCIKNKRDIVLKTSGKSYGNYCYLNDAIKSFFYILSKGNSGETYNVVGDNNCFTIYDMASIVAKELSGGLVKVVTCTDNNSIYAKPTCLKMDNTKLKKIGWQPKYNIVDMYKRMIG